MMGLMVRKERHLMSKCYICDKSMDEVALDGRDMKPKPCSECEAAIQECLEGYDDLEQEDRETIPALEEDDNPHQFFRKLDQYIDEYNACKTDLGDT